MVEENKYPITTKWKTVCGEPSVGELQKLAKLFSITVDELINPEEVTLKEVVIEDKTVSEKVRFISQLDQEDQHAVYRIIDGMLIKKNFKLSLNKICNQPNRPILISVTLIWGINKALQSSGFIY